MSAIEIDSHPVKLDSLFDVSLNFSFVPLQKVLASVFEQLKKNTDSVARIQEKLGFNRYCWFKYKNREDTGVIDVKNLPVVVSDLKVYIILVMLFIE